MVKPRKPIRKRKTEMVYSRILVFAQKTEMEACETEMVSSQFCGVVRRRRVRIARAA